MADVLSILVPHQPITFEEWLLLIEARRAEIAPYLDTFTLPPIGTSIKLRSEVSQTHDLHVDGPEMVGLTRSSQGLFRSQDWKDVERRVGTGYAPDRHSGHVACPDGTLKAWGLLRENKWVLVTVDFVGEPGYRDRGYERAVHVEVREVDINTLLRETKVGPRVIWDELENLVLTWLQQAKSRYENLQHLAEKQWAHRSVINVREMTRE